MKLVIATNNQNKVNEIKDIIESDFYDFFSLSDLGLNITIEETEDTLEGNALIKSREVYNITKIPSISDDTGLFVDALRGKPGVFSSRYAGENATYDDNCNKLLYELRNIPEVQRTAFFKTIVCLYLKTNQYFFFEGVVKGIIINEKRGTNGFGYDPLFIPEGYSQTYAEMEPSMKNQISHRAIAFKKLKDFLINYLK